MHFTNSIIPAIIFLQVRYYFIDTISKDSVEEFMNELLFDTKSCPIARVSKVFQGKWTMVILHILSEGTLRFGEIKRKLPDVTDSNLTKDLRLLESYGVIHREVYPVVPPKVEYSLTGMGKDFLPILDSINKWAEKYTTD